MTELLFKDPCLLFALGREAGPFLNEFRPHQKFPGAPCWARFCGPSWLTVLVLETGIGPTRTTRALEWLLNRPVLENVPYKPGVILSAGFAGSLQEWLHVGDVVLAAEVVDLGGNCWPTTWPGELPAGEWRPPLHRGRLVTSPCLVTTPQEKQLLGQQAQALAVDMESAAMARLCTQHGIPFGCVRAVSDRVDTALSPKLLSLLSGAKISPVRTLATLVRSPRLLPELRRLARDTRQASAQLGLALGELLTLTLPWMDEQ